MGGGMGGGMEGGSEVGMEGGMGGGRGQRGGGGKSRGKGGEGRVGGGMGGGGRVGGGMGGGVEASRIKRSLPKNILPVIWIDEIYDSLSMDTILRAKRQAPTDLTGEEIPDSMFDRLKSTFAYVIDKTKELYHKVRNHAAKMFNQDTSSNMVKTLE